MSCVVQLLIYTSGQPQSKPRFHPPPKTAGASSSLPQHPGHRTAPPGSTHSTSSTRGGASSSLYTREQRRGRGRTARDYNCEGYPHSKRARMSNNMAEEEEDFEDNEMKRKSNVFISARDQHVRKYM